MTGLSKVAEARIEAERARDKVMASAQSLQARLSPKILARDAWEGTKSKGADLVEDAVDAVKARPYAAGGVAAAIALFLAREPLIDLAGKIVDGVKKKPEAKRPRKRSARKTSTESKENG
ncbi:MAG TPA: hypothetical protein VFK50_09445 [Sphingomicrobium sp.]|nr:hypothetical protein [Sphingomicrobium sp.]